MDQRLFQSPWREQGALSWSLLSSPAAAAMRLKDAGTAVDPGAQPDFQRQGRVARKERPLQTKAISLIPRCTPFLHFSISETAIHRQ